LSPAILRSSAAEIEAAERTALKHKQDKLKLSAPTQYWYSVHPHGKGRQRWDMLNIALIWYSAMAIPFNICFSHEAPMGLQIWNYLVDVFFGVDILLNFVTGVEIDVDTDKNNITSPEAEIPTKVAENLAIKYDLRQIATSYFKGWFFLDAVSTFPWELIVGSDSDSTSLPQVLKVLKLSKLFRLLRIFRIMRVVRIVNRLEYSLDIQEGFRHLSKQYIADL
jgi:hyperpolarization activated cyclic nucleotide-gated potassium channel 2